MKHLERYSHFSEAVYVRRRGRSDCAGASYMRVPDGYQFSEESLELMASGKTGTRKGRRPGRPSKSDAAAKEAVRANLMDNFDDEVVGDEVGEGEEGEVDFVVVA